MKLNKSEQNLALQDLKKEYTAAPADISKIYLGIVILSALAAISAIVIAVHIRVLYGLALGMAAALCYTFATSFVLKKKLGISYRSESGKLTVTKYDAKGNTQAWIPERLIWLDVTEIDDGAFAVASSGNLREIHLPGTIIRIGADAFAQCPKLERIYFDGGAEDFGKIEIESDLSSYKIVLKACPPADCEVGGE